MDHRIYVSLFALGLFLRHAYSLLEVGRRIGARPFAKDPGGERKPASARCEGRSLRLASSGCSNRVYFQKSPLGIRFTPASLLMIEETNGIGTAYLRLDLLSTKPQPAGLLQKISPVRRYTAGSLSETTGHCWAKEELAKADGLQVEMWRQWVPPGGSRALQPRRRCCSCPR